MPTITAEERDLLERPAVATLAITRPNRAPHHSLVWYRLVDDALHVVTPATARKARHLTRFPHASALVVHPDNPFAYLALDVEARVIDDDALARSELRQIAARYLGEAAAEPYAASISAAPRLLIALDIEKVRASLRQPPKPAASDVEVEAEAHG
jgi:PPOX class probable F420-dependent enzyme